MTAAVAPLPSTITADIFLTETPAEARKRRREILSSSRTNIGSDSEEVCEPNPKKSKTSTTSSKQFAKKPQMKYDPEVPMTKEEAAAWRREQRRKRNRESAAASRQRQRDRINELEIEVNEWKVKYEEMMEKIRDLESLNGVHPSEAFIRSESPRPNEAKTVTPRASPLATASMFDVDGSEDTIRKEDEEVMGQYQSKMISRPA